MIREKTYWRSRHTTSGRLHHPRQHSFIINIPIASDLPRVVAVHLNNLGKVIVYSIEFKLLVLAPGNSLIQRLTGSAGPEDQLVAKALLIAEILNKGPVRFTEFRPVAIAKRTIEVYSDELIICIPDGPHSFSSGRTDSGGNSFSMQRS